MKFNDVNGKRDTAHREYIRFRPSFDQIIIVYSVLHQFGEEK